MASKLRYKSIKRRLFLNFSLFTLFPITVFGLSGNSGGICSHRANSIATINVYANSNAVEKSGQAGEFRLRRTNDLDRQISVPFLLSGTAKNNIDYKRVATTIRFEAGESEKTILIVPIDDTDTENREDIKLSLSPGIGYILGNHISDTVYLDDANVQTLKGSLGKVSANGKNARNSTTNQKLKFLGGSAGCKIRKIEWLNQSTNNSSSFPASPAGAELIPDFGIVKYKIDGCTPGSTLSIGLAYSDLIPADTKLMQFGPTSYDISDHWSEIRSSELKEREVVYKIRDGQSGDPDLTVNGTFTGIVGLFVPKRVRVAAPTPPVQGSNTAEIRSIPAINPIGLFFMMICLAGLATRSFADAKSG